MPTGRPSLFHEFCYRCTEPFHIDIHSPPLYEIVYVHECDGVYPAGDRDESPVPGLFLISDGTKRTSWPADEERRYVYSSMSIQPAALKALETPANGIDLLLPFEVLGRHHIRLTDEARKECEDIWLRISRFTGSSDWVDFNRLVMSVFDLLILSYIQFEPAMKALNYTVTDKERNVRNMITYLESALHEDITLDGMEKQLHLSKQYMSKIFRESMGMTIFDYLYRRRIDLAKALLQERPDLSVIDICLQAGFKNGSHFSRMFKAHVGVTPESYRKHAEELLSGDAESRKSNRVKSNAARRE